MKLTILLAAVGIGVAGSATSSTPPIVRTQLVLQPQNNNDPYTGLSPANWLKLATTIVNGQSVVGKPEVFMANATGHVLTAVMCNSYKLVGIDPYITNNPTFLPAWKVTLVHTNGFTNCNSGLVGQDDSGNVYKAALVSADNTFRSATFIKFIEQQ